MSSPPTDAERRRLDTLASYGVLDTPPETDFDDLVRLAAQICGAPIALISLIDANRQWFKAVHGLDILETDRQIAFCDHAIRQQGTLIVPDATADARFARNPLVSGPPYIRFYAGAPLRAPDGDMLGALCVLDRTARGLDAEQERALTVLSRHVMAQFELRRQAQERNRMNRALLSLLEDERLAEAAVRGSAALNRAVLDSMLAHIAVVDKEGRIIAVNRTWRQFATENAGDKAELLARTDVGANYLEACRSGIAAGDPYATSVYSQLGALLRGENEGFTLEYPCDTPRGMRWFLLSATPLRTAAGGALVSHLDITERKQAEDLLRISNERFEMLSRATNDAVRDWDLVHDQIWWNEGYATLFGVRPTEGTANLESWSNRIHAEDRGRVVASLRRALDGGADSWSDSYRFERRDGTYAHVSDRGHLIRDARGKATRMLAGMTDVTERVALEGQLRQAHRLEAIGQLTGGVAHDFNNLLTVIMGNAELIRERAVSDESLHESAGMIVEASRSAAELTKRLLAFARKQALSPAAVDAGKMIRDMHPLLKRTLGEQIEIVLRLADDLWCALVDAVQLESALLNLCINSRDAMAAGGRLVIETANTRLDQEYAWRQVELKAGDYVMIAVTDTGCGIPASLLSRVFEPFFTTKDKTGGTGLGLAMVYGFIKQSGGHISIYSEQGHGTTVKMFLPRSTAMHVPEVAATGAFRVLHGMERILLVEDNEQVRRFAAANLESLGYTVLQAANGHDALEVLATHEDVDLLFTDMVMPGGMSGRQLADAARERWPRLKVLFTSGYTEDGIVHHGRLDPGVQLLSKPYRRSELARRIRTLLDSN